ncbi:PREDICTED: acetylajmalan esterase-like [Ipomoea nil]|uniref:acetylajmalan esterase-like n=1 Tax=Ipomoea nil TaxID=35883 RepID=UPI0009009D24|nr:PREDICTED: acetylajmalan esterase-like [Ipomoea nil]
MASSFFLTAFILFPLAFAANSPHFPSFKRLYQFGDSLADTGNLIRLPGRGGSGYYPPEHLPYGQTFFGKPTGRVSDGRLIVDFIAAALKLPFLDAYLNANGSFAHGVNFAVSGATALDEDFFAKRNINTSNFRPPISKQLEWFETHLNSTGARSESLEDSLFIFGEFGGNDYFHFIRQGTPLEEIRANVPYVVAAIIHGIKRIVHLGAKRIVVPGPFPFGCLPPQLASSNSSDPADYDGFGCLKALNAFTSYHNDFLKRALFSLNRELSGDGVVVVYGDYEGAFLEILRKPSSYGFDKEWLIKACCGGGGKYNINPTKRCGTNGTTVCPRPGHAVNWDGVHLTDASYHRISHILIHQSISKLI